jgi:hypothetical protein
MSLIHIILISLLLLFMVIHVACGMKMYFYTVKKGEKPSFFLLRLKILSAVDKYRIITKQEFGKIGYLFYVWIISVNLALTSLIALLILNLLPVIHEYIIVISNTRAASIFSNILLQ